MLAVGRGGSDERQPVTSPLDDFVSGTSGEVSGLRLVTRALIADAVADSLSLCRLQRPRLHRAAAAWPRRRVLALTVHRTGLPNLLVETRAELARSRHRLTFAAAAAEDRGKFENLNRLLAVHRASDYDWLLIVDDDVRLPRGFLDAFVFLCERFDLRVAQPAHARRSHAAWQVTRRRAGSVARETNFVEIGPVVGLQAVTFDVLLPFPPLRAGWGLDAHWAAVARVQGWRRGVIDATAVRHGLRRIAANYDRAAAVAEGRRFLAGRPYLGAREAQQTLATHTSWK